MKVAQLTFNTYNNYGNVLQKYALQRILERFVDFTEVLWFNGNMGSSHFWAETGDIPQGYPIAHYLREAVRMSKFKAFDERYIKTRFNLPYLEETGDEYDFFVVGSDQVWNPFCEPYNMPLNIKFLDFVPNEKKIAYAASIARHDLPDEIKDIFRDGVASFSHVSVREENAVRIIEELGLKPPLLVVDPIFLLTSDEWLKIARRPSWFNEKYERGYILTYFIHHLPSPELMSWLAESKLPFINLLRVRSINFYTKNFNHYTTSPEEFLYLMAHASLVLASSFHGVAFPILFKRPFINCESDATSTHYMAMRIPSLLKTFGLENRVVYTDDFHKIDSPFEVDFSQRDKVLPQERMKAFNFLANALGVEMPTELREVNAR